MKKDAMMARALDYMLCIACGQRKGATHRLTAVTAERDEAYLREERMYRQLEDARHELQEVTAERDQLRFGLQLTKTVLLDVERNWAGSDGQYTRLMDAFAVINNALEGPK